MKGIVYKSAVKCQLGVNVGEICVRGSTTMGGDQQPHPQKGYDDQG